MESAWSLRSATVLRCGPSRLLSIGPVDIDLDLPLFSINCWVFIPLFSISGRSSLKNHSESNMASLILLFAQESSIFNLFLNGLRNCPFTFGFCLSILKPFVFDTQFAIEVALLPVLKSLKVLYPSPWFGATKTLPPCPVPNSNLSRATWPLAKVALAFPRPSSAPPLRTSVNDTPEFYVEGWMPFSAVRYSPSYDSSYCNSSISLTFDSR